MKRRFWLIAEAEVRLFERGRSSEDDHFYGSWNRGGRGLPKSQSERKRLAKSRSTRTAQEKERDKAEMYRRLKTPPPGLEGLEKGDRVKLTVGKAWGHKKGPNEVTYTTTFVKSSKSDHAIWIRDSPKEPKQRLAWVFVKRLEKTKNRLVPDIKMHNSRPDEILNEA